MASDARFLGAMLEQGILPPSSQVEASLPSLAHGPVEIESTLAAARTAVGKVAVG